MDVRAVKAAGDKAVQWCREGKGPFILQMETYRYRGHSMSDPAKYRTRDEVDKVREQHDPIETYGRLLMDRGIVTADQLKAFDKDLKSLVIDATELAATA